MLKELPDPIWEPISKRWVSPGDLGWGYAFEAFLLQQAMELNKSKKEGEFDGIR